MNILVHTYWISPSKGSEFSVTWNYVEQMRKKHKLYVIVGSTSYKINDFSELVNKKLENVEFIFIPPNLLTRVLSLFYNLNISAWSSYLAYNSWERQLFSYIKNAKFYNEIDLIHFVGPVGFHEPGYLYKFDKPYIWGPIGGFEMVDKVFWKTYKKGKNTTRIKNILNKISLLFSVRVKKIMRKADLIIACTNSNKKIIENKYSPPNLMYYPENSMSINEDKILSIPDIQKKYNSIDNRINILWVGSFLPGKMPGMLMDVLKKIKFKEKIKFIMIGDGPLLLDVKKEAMSNDLNDFIEFTGRIEREEVTKYFYRAHLHIITSSYEANTTVMFESMAACVPTITIDHCGFSDLIDNNNGIKIPLSSYEKMVESFAYNIDILSESPGLMLDCALNLRVFSKNYTMNERANFFDNCYKLAINNFKLKKS